MVSEGILLLLFYCSKFFEDKERREGAQKSIVNGIRDAVEKYNSDYVFSFENMRNIKFKEFRQQFRHNGKSISLFFFCF